MFKKEQPKEAPDFEYFVLFDSKVGVYREPVLAINRHDILRQLSDDMKNPKFENSQVFTNAEDFSLFKVGEFSKKTGQITSTPHEHVANLHELRAAVLRQRQNAQPPRPERPVSEQNPPLGIVST